MDAGQIALGKKLVRPEPSIDRAAIRWPKPRHDRKSCHFLSVSALESAQSERHPARKRRSGTVSKTGTLNAVVNSAQRVSCLH